ncbi:hypothetical protein V5O48_013555 [Marasmius crinis-equi]|uniref:Uncharacterized protein n=1 Tax=Marasmius crinis-equi TaxID=585013 RepID=A0ABR3F049_9AGAR
MPPTIVAGVPVVVFLVGMILVEGFTITYMWQRRASLSDIRMHGSDGHYPFQSFVRIVFYTLVGGFGIM